MTTGDTTDAPDTAKQAEALANAMFNRQAMQATLSPVAARRLALFPSDLPGMVAVVIGSAGHGVIADDDGNPTPLADASVTGSFLVPTDALASWGIDILNMTRPGIMTEVAKLIAKDGDK